MNDVTALSAASTETEGRLKRLRTLYDRRTKVQEEIRRGIGHADRDAILLELCAFRGMQYTEAAEHLGVVREAVGKRIRPIVTELGLDGLSLIQRQNVKVTRPHRRKSVDDLVAQLRPEREVIEQKRAEADQLREEILAEMDHLHAAGMSWVQMAAAMEISVPTLQRLRGTM